ncbi:MAG: hypothetical protein ACYDBQ_03645 [Thermoplasmatota archaeon]
MSRTREQAADDIDDEPAGRGLQVRRVQVTFTEAQWALIASLRGIMGDSDATVVRSVVMAWLAEKSLLTTVAKERLARWPLATLRKHDAEVATESGQGRRRAREET